MIESTPYDILWLLAASFAPMAVLCVVGAVVYLRRVKWPDYQEPPHNYPG